MGRTLMLYVSNKTKRQIAIEDLGVRMYPGETWHLVDSVLPHSYDLESLISIGELAAWDKQSLIWIFRDIEWNELS